MNMHRTVIAYMSVSVIVVLSQLVSRSEKTQREGASQALCCLVSLDVYSRL